MSKMFLILVGLFLSITMYEIITEIGGVEVWDFDNILHKKDILQSVNVHLLFGISLFFIVIIFE